MKQEYKKLHIFLIVLFVLQPLMDILSYWTQQLGSGSTLTLLLRFGVMAAVFLTGFLLAENKRVYYIFALCCGLLLACHCGVCLYAGYESIVTDVTNFVRVAQMPAFAICMITFLKRDPTLSDTMERALQLNFWLITASVILSILTSSAQPTYTASGYGVIGWFATTNSQSAVMSVLSVFVVMQAIRRGNFPYFLAVTFAAFLQLYFMGPRLSFLALGVTAVGGIASMALLREFHLRYALVLSAGLVVCFAAFHQSPMYLSQVSHNSEMAQKQVWEEEMYERELEGDSSTANGAQSAEAAEETDAGDLTQAAQQHALTYIYEYYTPKLCARFGTQRVMEVYDYTRDVNTLMAERPKKIIYCRLLLQEHPFLSKLFGMELSKMTFDGYVFDVENDFHGIFFLYGAVGLAMILLFLLYFVFRTARCLVRDFRQYFTLEAAGFGMAFLILMVYAYCTAGVLRRPNASFYLSAVLAMIWHLTRPQPQTTLTDNPKQFVQPRSTTNPLRPKA